MPPPKSVAAIDTQAGTANGTHELFSVVHIFLFKTIWLDPSKLGIVERAIERY